MKKFEDVISEFISSNEEKIEVECKNKFERMIVHTLADLANLYHQRHTSEVFVKRRDARVERYYQEHISFCNYGRGCSVCKDREWREQHRVPIDCVLVSKVPLELSRKDVIHQKK